MYWKTLLALAIFALPWAQNCRADTAVPDGQWLTEDGDSAAAFMSCGKAICARLVWFRAPQHAPAGAPLDSHNPNTALRTRPLCGLVFITGLQQNGPGAWRDGRVYAAGSGKTYDLDVNADGPDRLRMRGFVGMRMLGHSFFLVRAKEKLAACG